MELEPIYTIKEVAKILKCSRQYIYKEIKKGNVKTIKFGGLKIKESEISRLVNKN